MNPRNNVIKAIEFKNPVRVPLVFPGYLDSDIVFLHYTPKVHWTSRGIKKDEWECLWRTADKTMGTVIGSPLIEWDNFNHYSFPDPPKENRFEESEKQILKCKSKKYTMGGVGFTLFERMHFLRGFDNLLIDLYLNSERVKLLADRVSNFQAKIIENWGKIGTNGIFFTDDWGTNEGLLINPELWRKIFKPFYVKLCNEVHRWGMHVFFHSDGQIHEIISDFIECGVDVLEIAQPHLFDLEQLAQEFGEQICFFGAVDKQTTLISGSKEQIIEEVKKLIRIFGAFNGGFIAMGDMEDYQVLEVPKENIRVMVGAFKQFAD